MIVLSNQNTNTQNSIYASKNLENCDVFLYD